MVAYLFAVQHPIQPSGQESEGTCKENATHGCHTKIGNETPHQRFCRGEFPFRLQTRHILLPHRSVSELNYVQGHDSTSTHAHGPGESVESRNTILLVLELNKLKSIINYENELYVSIFFGGP